MASTQGQLGGIQVLQAHVSENHGTGLLPRLPPSNCDNSSQPVIAAHSLSPKISFEATGKRPSIMTSLGIIIL